MKNDLLTVSAVITTYKRPPHILLRAISSVLNQSYRQIELIIIDDNREDKYLIANKSLIESITDNRITYLVNTGKHGACSARNLGAKQATGSILAFLDDDDTWKSNKIERMIQEIKGDYGLVYCNSDYYREDKLIQSNVELKELSDDPLHSIVLSNYVGGCSIPIMKKEVFDEVGGFDEDQPASQDIDLWIRMFQKTKFFHVREPLVDYYFSDDSITRNLEKQNLARIRLLNKYKELYDKFPDAREARVYRITITYFLQNKNKEGYQFLIRNSNSNKINKMFKLLKLFGIAQVKKIVNKNRGYN